MQQYLDQNIKLQNNPPAIHQDYELLLTYYRKMITVRTFDYKAIALQRTGQMGTYPSVLGHEVTSAAIGMTMQTNDVFVPYYRDQVTQYIRGVSFTEMLQYWGGDERGNNFKNCPNDLPWSVPIASQTLHAAGVAFAIKYKKQKQCCVATIGDGGTSEGDFYEAINVAGAMDLPLVIVVYNNQWAISTPLSKQTKCTELSQKALAANIIGITVDGNDIIAMHDVLTTAINNARAHQIPSIIEAVTYRLGDHTTADDASQYRSDSELQYAWEHDGVSRLEQYLLQNKVLTKDLIAHIKQEAKDTIDQAILEYQNLSPMQVDELFKHQFANMPANLQNQLQNYYNE